MNQRRNERGTLLEQVAARNPAAVQAVISNYGSLVWSLARRMVSDRDLAEDAVQEIFIDVWKSAERFDPSISSEAAFITTIARRRLIDLRRRIQRRPEVAGVQEDSMAEDDARLNQLELCDEAARASEALKRLKPEQRQVIALSVYRGLTHDQIAASTGMPLGTVKSHLRRGLLRVRELLGAAPEPSSGEVSQ